MSSPSETFPVINTGRCLLRKIIAADQQEIFEGLSHPKVTKYYAVSYASFEATKAQMDFYNDLLSNGTGIWWAVCLGDSEAFIGACGFNNFSGQHKRAEIGFWLLPAFPPSLNMVLSKWSFIVSRPLLSREILTAPGC